MTNKEQFLFSALDLFKDMIKNGECSKQDINYFCDFSKRELEASSICGSEVEEVYGKGRGAETSFA